MALAFRSRLWCVDWLTRHACSTAPRHSTHPMHACRSLAASRHQHAPRRFSTAAVSAAGSSGGQPLARSVRPIPITVIIVAKGNSQGAEAMAAEWADKLRR